MIHIGGDNIVRQEYFARYTKSLYSREDKKKKKKKKKGKQQKIKSIRKFTNKKGNSDKIEKHLESTSDWT